MSEKQRGGATNDVTEAPRIDVACGTPREDAAISAAPERIKDTA